MNYRTFPEWGGKILALIGGRGVDHVIGAGGSGTLQQSIEAVRVGGSIFMLGILTGFGGEIETFALTMKQITLKGVVVGSRQDQEAVTKAIEINGIVPVVDRTFSLNDLGAAYRFRGESKHFGKVVIEL